MAKLPVRAVVVSVVAASSAAWLSFVVVQDVRRSPDADCIAVDSGLSDGIAGRATGEPIRPTVARAVHDPWVRTTESSVRYESYYAIAMEFVRSDGSTATGVWGLASHDSEVPGGQTLARGAQLTNVDQVARELVSNLPAGGMYFPEDANSVKLALKCIEFARGD